MVRVKCFIANIIICFFIVSSPGLHYCHFQGGGGGITYYLFPQKLVHVMTHSILQVLPTNEDKLRHGFG